MAVFQNLKNYGTNPGVEEYVGRIKHIGRPRQKSLLSEKNAPIKLIFL